MVGHTVRQLFHLVTLLYTENRVSYNSVKFTLKNDKIQYISTNNENFKKSIKCIRDNVIF